MRGLPLFAPNFDVERRLQNFFFFSSDRNCCKSTLVGVEPCVCSTLAFFHGRPAAKVAHQQQFIRRVHQNIRVFRPCYSCRPVLSYLNALLCFSCFLRSVIRSRLGCQVIVTPEMDGIVVSLPAIADLSGYRVTCSGSRSCCFFASESDGAACSVYVEASLFVEEWRWVLMRAACAFVSPSRPPPHIR